MKLIKTIALGILLLGSVSVNAQTDRKAVNQPTKIATVQSIQLTPEQKGEARANQLSERVSLTEEQFGKVKELFTNIEIKNKGVNDNPNISATEKSEIIKSHNEYEQNALKGILTPEQLKKLDTTPPSTNSVK